ncbi:HAT C-terminal dimerization domain [Trinorchestia longiramus]|nr:HAT C-terminal dimerization domain [Trinorchestia longiramus]
MQGGEFNIIEAEENLKAFQKKLPLWKRRTENNNFANFPLLDDCSQVQQQLFKTTTFLCQQMATYPVIAKKALQIFIPFVTTLLCEQSFSRMLGIKTKKRNRHCCENDMRVVLAKVKPRITELVSERQQQKSH